MKIKILHLYYDILNLYGENGNVKAMKNYLENQGIDVQIKFASIEDEINLEDIDLIYLGMGTEENQILALKHIMKYKKEIKNYIDNNGFILSTGNSLELFGKKIIKENKTMKSLNIFNYETIIEAFRLIDEILCKNINIKDKIIGFTNRNSVIKSNSNELFEIIKGIGNTPNTNLEGYHEKNFYGTYIIGPLLIRNPEFLEYLMKELITSKDPNFTIKEVDLDLERNAYNEFIKNINK